jgi:IS5 family transposase
VKSAIAPPSDSRLLNDGIRVLSRYLATSRSVTGFKIRFKDFRKPSKALAFRIFNAKKAEKYAYYVELLTMADKVIGQVERGMSQVKSQRYTTIETAGWLKEMAYYRDLTLRVMDQTRRRVIGEENVPANEKIVSLFEPHTAIIIKDKREVLYGHKINIASDKQGLLTHVSIEEGNAADVERYLPIIEAHQRRYQGIPNTVVADGSYASQHNLEQGRAQGIKRLVFHKKKGIKISQMGVKQKTYDKLKNFRAGVEGNISELKRVFGLGKATWKGYEGFHAYVLASAIAYNLVRLVRIETG